ncbi:glycosyltransferase [Clostridiaceae bacterium]|nr:glycosyltransferase [Clostridiaceae bacterium]RKI13623.1 glycosyltransferase [bacterium 1XD21-70]
MDKIVISVIVLTYNHEKYLAKCLEGIYSQKTSFAYEVLIHDDASTDHTQEIILDFAEKNRNKIKTKTVFQKTNQFSEGDYHMDEYLYPLVEGEYVAYCEGDDYWCDQNKLEKQYKEIKKRKDCTICAHKVRCINNDEKFLFFLNPKNWGEGVINGEDILRDFLHGGGWPFQTSAFLVKSEIVKNHPDFWEIFHVGDKPLLIWSLACGNLYYIDEVMSCYRLGSVGSMTQLTKGREYALDKIITNAAGFRAFDEITNHKYWDDMKHMVLYLEYQRDMVNKKKIEKIRMQEYRKELSIKERVIAALKFTVLGNIMRNLRADIKIKR